MKKLIILLVAILTINIASAQKNFPMPADNPFWTEIHGSLWSCSTAGTHGVCNGYYCQCTTPVYYKSDTIINSIIYNRLYSRGVCNAIYPMGQPPDGCPNGFNYTNPEVIFATLRQDTLNKIVYILDNNTEKIVYDFKHIIVGNDYPKTYNNNQNDTLVVLSLDSILLNNIYFKKWNLGTKHNNVISDSGFVCIIEGIGSTFGILANLVPPFENNDNLSCFSINNNVLYPNSTYNCDKTVNVKEYLNNHDISVYPNPSSNKITINYSQLINNGELLIYNTLGQLMYEEKLTKASSQKEINTHNFRAGLYKIVLREKGIIKASLSLIKE